MPGKGGGKNKPKMVSKNVNNAVEDSENNPNKSPDKENKKGTADSKAQTSKPKKNTVPKKSGKK